MLDALKGGMKKSSNNSKGHRRSTESHRNVRERKSGHEEIEQQFEGTTKKEVPVRKSTESHRNVREEEKVDMEKSSNNSKGQRRVTGTHVNPVSRQEDYISALDLHVQQEDISRDWHFFPILYRVGKSQRIETNLSGKLAQIFSKILLKRGSSSPEIHGKSQKMFEKRKNLHVQQEDISRDWHFFPMLYRVGKSQRIGNEFNRKIGSNIFKDSFEKSPEIRGKSQKMLEALKVGMKKSSNNSKGHRRVSGTHVDPVSPQQD
ncbi:hypothetical protein CEXT_519991 [Caerostris extrusa]|uniref:Uncharacterized protein n=1 Tax=Caerostris extrusa TaxID=172846 RepID=A0AAV4SKV9_CAEEX|nr:hypothetical protein CEXT_519991 [Caerostris extrusa]